MSRAFAIVALGCTTACATPDVARPSFVAGAPRAPEGAGGGGAGPGAPAAPAPAGTSVGRAEGPQGAGRTRRSFLRPSPRTRTSTASGARRRGGRSAVAVRSSAAGVEPNPALALSVEAATMLALQNNPDLQVQSFGPVVAGTFERVERGVFDPELFVEAQYQRERASQTARATGERFDVEGSSTDVRIGVRQRFSSGTDVEAVLSHQLDESDRTPEQQQARVGLTVTQALLRGFGSAVNLAAVRQAALEREASVFQLRGFTEALIADAEDAYWAYALAQEEMAIFTRSVEVARQEARDIQARIDVGVLPELEVAAAMAEVARREQALIDARSRLEEARLRLNRLVSPDQNGGLDAQIETTTELRIEPTPMTEVEARTRLAERHRPDLAEARLRQRQNRLQTVVTRDGVLPRLDLFVSLGKSGFSDGLGASFRNLGEPTYDVTAGLRLSHLLGNRAASGRDLAAYASLRQGEAAIENLRRLACFEVRLALNEVARARAQIRATRTTRALQERAVTAEKERFNIGTGTALLVAQAQRDLLASRIDEVRAVVDYRRALVRLYRAEGTLLLRRGVVIEMR